jgi:LEA14-like dessication related protein
LVFAACAVQRPTARVDSASLTGVSLSTLEVTLDMTLDNPNDFELPLERIDWVLDLWGQEFGRGDITMTQTVPAMGSAKLAVPLAVGINAVASAAARLIQGEDIGYGVHGDLVFATVVGPISVSFADAGQWDNPL